MVLGIFLLLFIVADVMAQSECPALPCGGQTYLGYYESRYFTSPGFPNAPYSNSLNCLWMVISPPFTAIRVECIYFNTAPSQGCSEDTFYFSPSGDCAMSDARKYCGSGTLDVTTTGRYFAAQFKSQSDSPNGYYGFWCYVTTVFSNHGAELVTPDPNPLVPTTIGTGECRCGVKGGNRIVGGEEAGVHEWPWQGGLRTSSEGALSVAIFCGASLISSQWAITAAHCVEQIGTSNIYISLGEHDKTSQAETELTKHVRIVEVIKHENFDPITIDNDITLLRLMDPVTFNDAISPICLPYQYASEDFQGEMGTVTGWGTLQHEGDTSNVLMEVGLPMLSSSRCREYSILEDAVTDNMMCTYEEGKDSCQGDSGGPLQWKKNELYYLVGIVSFGFNCGAKDSPGVYTKVNNYLQWIQQKTGENFCSA